MRSGQDNGVRLAVVLGHVLVHVVHDDVGRIGASSTAGIGTVEPVAPSVVALCTVTVGRAAMVCLQTGGGEFRHASTLDEPSCEQRNRAERIRKGQEL